MRVTAWYGRGHPAGSLEPSRQSGGVRCSIEDPLLLHSFIQRSALLFSPSHSWLFQSAVLGQKQTHGFIYLNY